MTKTILLAIFLALSFCSSAFATDWSSDSAAVVVLTLDEASGTFQDSTSNNNDATNNGATYGATGQFGDAADLEKDDPDYLDAGSAGTLDITSAITMTAWVNLESDVPSSGNEYIIGSKGDSNNFYKFRIDENDCLEVVLDTGATKVCTDSGASCGYNAAAGWVHAAFTYDGSNIRIYGDGSEIQTCGDTGSIDQDVNDNLLIGGNDDGVGGTDREFDGLIDEFGLFNEAKSSTDINDMLDNGLVQTVTSTFKAKVIIV